RGAVVLRSTQAWPVGSGGCSACPTEDDGRELSHCGRVYAFGEPASRIRMIGLVSSGGGGSMREAWIVVASTLAVAAARAQGSDDYTRYELLAPETAQFRIVYEVTATTPGALFYFNPIRKGSEASDEAVYDPASGKPLRFEVVDGAAARAAGEAKADLDTRYIKVVLPRPGPRGGELGLRMD